MKLIYTRETYGHTLRLEINDDKGTITTIFRDGFEETLYDLPKDVAMSKYLSNYGLYPEKTQNAPAWTQKPDAERPAPSH